MQGAQMCSLVSSHIFVQGIQNGLKFDANHIKYLIGLENSAGQFLKADVWGLSQQLLCAVRVRGRRTE